MRTGAVVRATVRGMQRQDHFETLRVEREGHLTWLTLDRPESLNAMNAALVRELRAFFWGLAEDAETRVVVMRGAGRAFCAGLDLKAHAAEPGAGRASVPDGLRAQRTISEIVMLMRRAPQPIIAAVHGAACAGGRHAPQYAARPPPHEGVPAHEPRCGEPRGGDRAGGPQPGARRGHGGLPGGRDGVPREASGEVPRRVRRATRINGCEPRLRTI